MLEDRSVLFLVASEEDVFSMKTSDDIFNLFFRYETASDIHNYSAFLALADLLFPNSNAILLNEVKSNLDDGAKLFLLNKDFVIKLVSFNDNETNALAQNWSDSYWENSSLGIWSQLFCLRFVCKKAIEKENNVYAING